MLSISLLSFASCATLVTAYKCISFVAPITVTAPSFIPAFPPFTSHYDSVAFLLAATARNASGAPSPFSGVKNITETFDIGVQYCTPSKGGYHSKRDVQILTHGLGFDRWVAEMSNWNPD